MAMQSYDEVYRKPEFYWGQEPNELCTYTTNLFPNNARGKVIDLGCGEGKDIIHFAKNRFIAVGVDVSEPGLQKALQWAEQERLAIRTVQASLNDFSLAEMYDVVYSSGTLTYSPTYHQICEEKNS